MALPLYNIKKTLSSTPSDYWKDSMQALIGSQFTNAPTIKTVKHNRRDIEVRVVGKFNSETLSRNNDNYQKIIFKTNDYVVSIGDLFEFDSLKWICTDVESTAVTKSCSVTKCNNTLNYYSPSDSTSTLYSIPCIIGKSTIKQDENKYLSLPADENIVICANNASTLKITENTRFILSGDAYSVVGISKIDNPGLLTIRIKEDLVIADDNITLGISNYYSNQSVKEIYILNGTYASLFYAESTLQLNVQCKENGIIITNPIVTYSSANTTIATVNSIGLITLHGTGDVVITATYGNVSDTITIHGDIAEVDNYNIMITPFDDTLKLSRSMILTGQVINKGIVDTTRHVGWSISNLDGTSNTYATITPNVDTCTILASDLSSSANKYVVVRASLIGDSTVYLDKQIKIINLF